METTETPMDGWVNKEVVCTCGGVLISHKEGNPAAVTARMNLEDILLSEISQRKTNTTRPHLHVESKKKKKKQTS